MTLEMKKVILDCFLESLGVNPDRVILVERVMAPHNGETVQINEHIIRVSVCPNLTLEDPRPNENLAWVLAHEAAHVWQIVTGLITYDAQGRLLWKGQYTIYYEVAHWEDQANAVEYAFMRLGLGKEEMKIFLPDSEYFVIAHQEQQLAEQALVEEEVWTAPTTPRKGVFPYPVLRG